MNDDRDRWRFGRAARVVQIHCTGSIENKNKNKNTPALLPRRCQ